MKKNLILIFFALLLSCSVVFAEDSNQAASAASAAVEVNNKICPVSKEKVGEMGKVIKYEYNGKIYNFCCAMCIKDFKKDPEKFSKIAEEEAGKNQNAGGSGHETHQH